MPDNIFAIIGDSDFIGGFKAAGFTLYEISDETAKIKEAFSDVVKKGFAVCLILESYAAKIKDMIDEYKEKPIPTVVPLADFRHKMNLAQELLRKATIEAVGTDITEKK
jgi:vacuolar-type H+-ATPase subunit F/Vma7